MVAPKASVDATADFDAIVIGVGVSGLYQLYKLRELGLRARVFETGTAVGGTWYWNRYPGARFDSESWTYGYSVSQELLDEWDWEEHFAGQPETERYLNYVADKFGLRRDIEFGGRVTAAHYQEDTRSWDVILADGRRYNTRFLITAVGLLSDTTMPRIAGVDAFKGQSCHTHYWSKEEVSFEGKRVAVIGTGATGVQTITEVAKTDFVACKIRGRVKDPAVAEKLIPKNHGFGTRRVPLESGYYEVYNQPNVKLVDINETPIERITPTGVRTSDAEYEFDIIIYATGFDAITGAFDRIDIRGVDGAALKEKWRDGPQTFLGILLDGFPNLLMVMARMPGLATFRAPSNTPRIG